MKNKYHRSYPFEITGKYYEQVLGINLNTGTGDTFPENHNCKTEEEIKNLKSILILKLII